MKVGDIVKIIDTKPYLFFENFTINPNKLFGEIVKIITEFKDDEEVEKYGILVKEIPVIENVVYWFYKDQIIELTNEEYFEYEQQNQG